MSRFARLAVGSIVLVLATATIAVAQTQVKPSLFLGGAITMPTGDYNVYAKPGWMGMAGLNLSVGDKGLWVGAEGVYGHNSHDVPANSGDATNLYGANGILGWRFGDQAKPGVYVYGSGGVLNQHFSPGTGSTVSGSNWKPSYGGGAGVDIPTGGKVNVWVEGRYLGRKGIQVVMGSAGISIALGH